MARSLPAFPELDGVRVLVVDDERDVRDLFSHALSHSGASVWTVESARAAIGILSDPASPVPDVVVTDLSMPGHDGQWLLRQIRSLPSDRGRDVPVVAVTAFGREYGQDRMLSIGFTEYLTKPVDPLRLCWVVARLARPGRPRA